MKNSIIFYFLLIQVALSLKSNDFCFLNQKNQQLLSCNKQQCGYDLCSPNLNACNLINEWNSISQRFAFLVNIKKELQIFFDFLENIQECKPSQYTNISKQVCSIEEKCKLNGLKQVLKSASKTPKQCVCTGKLRFVCGKHYCSNNKYTCEKALKYMNLLRIKKC